VFRRCAADVPAAEQRYKQAVDALQAQQSSPPRTERPELASRELLTVAFPFAGTDRVQQLALTD
jgi:hypothetical protein